MQGYPCTAVSGVPLKRAQAGNSWDRNSSSFFGERMDVGKNLGRGNAPTGGCLPGLSRMEQPDLLSVFAQDLGEAEKGRPGFAVAGSGGSRWQLDRLIRSD